MTAGTLNEKRLTAALETAVNHLLRQRHPDGYWEGLLSSSALSTATAVSALALAGLEKDRALVQAGVDWLSRTQNADGGWGDTPDSPSNLATTLLSTSALRLAFPVTAQTTTGGGTANDASALANADAYLSAHAGDTPDSRMAAVRQLYGEDRTFAVPILMNCALARLVPWEGIPGLPFEMAVVPHRWYKLLRLHVVSYALPALIAIGLLLEATTPSRNPLRRLARRWAIPAVLTRLARLQPEHGGYLDATPLTAFVAMSLIARFGHEHPVAARCLRFLRASRRDDGSWPIDTNLSCWVTTSAVTALAHAGSLSCIETAQTQAWIAARQYRQMHPFTHALPGGWGWTHLPGGVPDADDTSGAIIALTALGGAPGIPAGAQWLRQLQNTDGGWPTFCRGWGKLPFDKSSPDVTAHAVRALNLCDPITHRQAIARGFRHLDAAQREDGAWVPLWFGNQRAPHQANAVFGTARVLPAYAECHRESAAAQRGVHYLIRTQNADGGWGGDVGVSSSIEESALAVSALAAYPDHSGVAEALARGSDYLLSRIEDGRWVQPAPIGLYFANLWYWEALYPVIWTIEALGRVCSSGVGKDKTQPRR